MDNNRFDIQIVTKTIKKWNIYIFVIFSFLLILSILILSNTYRILVIIWTIVAAAALLYEYKNSNSFVLLSTELLFNDDGFSIFINDNHFNLLLKKEDITKIKFDKKKNHIMVLQDDNILCDFFVRAKSMDELYDVFNSFGYQCELDHYI